MEWFLIVVVYLSGAGLVGMIFSHTDFAGSGFCFGLLWPFWIGIPIWIIGKIFQLFEKKD